MSFLDPQNPGIGGLDELTDAEATTLQQITALGDPGADRILFWDESENSYNFLTAGTGLTITGTTISASGGGTIDGSGTTNELVYWVDSDTIGALAVATYPSLTELSYVKGVTSAIQTQLNNKAAALGADDNYVTDAEKVVIGNTSGTNTGDQTSIVGISGTKAEFNTAVSDGDIAFLNAANAFSVGGQTITVADTTNVKGLTIYANDTTNSPLALQVGPDSASVSATTLVQFNDDSGGLYSDWAFNVSGNGVPVIMLQSTNGTLAAPTASSTGRRGSFEVYAYNATPAQTLLARISGYLNDGTAGSEDGAIRFSVMTAGSFTDELTLTGGSLQPIANDGIALGATNVGFSDFYLASGAVIGFANNDVTLTHSSNLLTLAGGDLTVPNLTVGAAGVVTLSENASVALDPAGSADGKYTGITITGTAGTTLAFGDLIYLDPTDSRWELADANAASAADGDARGILGICVLAAAGDASATTILLNGVVRADTAFPAMTINSPMYVSETAGDITGTAPTTTDAVVRVVGYAITADEIYFNPASGYQTAI